MSKEPPTAGTPFNLDKLKELIEMMEKNGLTEIDLRSGAERWQLRRGPQEVTQVVSAGPFAGMHMPPPMPMTPAAVQLAPAGSSVMPAAAPADDGVVIKSPTVGTFYVAAAPTDPPFVSVGSKVKEDTVVCIIEAMKVFNQIPAEMNGTITAVLVKNGDPVEFGQPLFKINLG
ncbi:MAG: acetyl-CoA carboxylase biotin carboxyl carrier protein [Planctomycetales bacterium]|nr:acetyl-CoA carboxylase biotin carboxyl carrier protein [Planctomycetales bacterium]